MMLLNDDSTYNIQGYIQGYVTRGTPPEVGIACFKGAVLPMYYVFGSIPSTAVHYMLQVRMRQELGGSTWNETLIWTYRGSTAGGTSRSEVEAALVPVVTFYSTHPFRHDWSTPYNAIYWDGECAEASVVSSGCVSVDMTLRDNKRNFILISFQVLSPVRSLYTHLMRQYGENLSCRVFDIVQVRQVTRTRVNMWASSSNFASVFTHYVVGLVHFTVHMVCLHEGKNHYYVCKSKLTLYNTVQCNCLSFNEING